MLGLIQNNFGGAEKFSDSLIESFFAVGGTNHFGIFKGDSSVGSYAKKCIVFSLQIIKEVMRKDWNLRLY